MSNIVRLSWRIRGGRMHRVEFMRPEPPVTAEQLARIAVELVRGRWGTVPKGQRANLVRQASGFVR